MKYNEAIEMILDGGEAYRDLCTNYVYKLKFINDILMQRCFCEDDCDCDNKDYTSDVLLSKYDHRCTDWIVEKDGVVYEEKPTHICKDHQVVKYLHTNGNAIVICTTCGKEENIEDITFIKDRAHEKYEPADILKWPDKSPKYEQPKQVSIDEDWLEKKMLCLIRRVVFTCINGCQILRRAPDDSCLREDCPFCFPEENPEVSALPAESVILYICIHGTYPCEECRQKHEEKNRYEQPREKVTAYEHIIAEIDYLRDCAYQRGACNMYYMPDAEHEKLSELRKKLEYLVSLQEK